jgi:formylglycine-generating enzyme required for sulfatase activity
MRYVPGGTFQMGSAETDPLAQQDEIPQHTVRLSSFWIDQTEVTNAQFALCVEAGACQPPFRPALDKYQGYYESETYADYPVINVSWEHAWNYCNWVDGTLPTEAQWEYAARGPENRVYPWGDEPPDETLLNYDRVVSDTTRVGSYPEGASWCGGLDMAGNVWEWTADWYRTYSPEPQVDPIGPNRGIGHVLRGGSWYDDESFVRAANRYVVREAYRDYVTPLAYGFGVGFRCVVPLEE